MDRTQRKGGDVSVGGAVPADSEAEFQARSRIFGTVAQEYDRIRPGYPDALVDDVLAACGGPGAVAVEAGAGTGKATVAFAERGMRITAVEPDPSMAAVLTERCAAYPGVTVVVDRFEDHEPDGRAGLCFSAQAWHWLDPVARRERVAAALAPGGILALFWNFDRIADPAVREEMARAHRELTPQLRLDDYDSRVPDEGLLDHHPGPELAGWAEFAGASARVYRWERTLSRQQYLDYLHTHSYYLLLDAEVRQALFARIAKVAPDPVLLAEDTVLYLARRI